MSEISEITFSGLANVPSDYNATDGLLAAAINLINEDGALRPIAPTTTVMQLDPGQRVTCLHTTADYEHYIVIDDRAGTLLWCNRPADAGKPALSNLAVMADLDGSPTAVLQVTPIGNTLVVLTDAGMQYFLWRENDKAYKYLGSKMPEVRLEFALEGRMMWNLVDNAYIEIDTFNSSNWLTTDFQSNNQKLWNDYAAPRLLESINVLRMKNKEPFCFPFFVRYAYRLYDQTLTMHSAPVLMQPSSGDWPIAVVTNSTRDDVFITSVQLAMFCGAAALVVKASTEADVLDEWRDIVTGIDVFITPQAWSWKSSNTDKVGRTFREMVDGRFYEPFCNMRFTQVTQVAQLADEVGEGAVKYHQLWDFASSIALAAGHEDEQPYYKYMLNLPYKTTEQIRDELLAYPFYLLKSYKLGDVKRMSGDGGWAKVDVDIDTVDGIAAREQMTDDSGSHDSLSPRGSLTYNGRLNIYDIERRCFAGFALADANPLTDGSYNVIVGNTWDEIRGEDTSSPHLYEVYVERDGVIMRSTSSSMFHRSPYWWYYPGRVDKAAIRDLAGSWLDLTDTMQPHPFLNGTYWFNNFKEPDWSPFRPSWLDVEDIGSTAAAIERLPSAVWTSEVSNPFVFPAAGQLTVGTGRVMGLGAATAALSQGQFGQFPLYAFTSDGVWALATGDDGQFIAAQPVSRDVCDNPSSITSLDNAIAFTTAQGLMLLHGSTVECLSDALRGQWRDLTAMTPHFAELLGMAGMDTGVLDGWTSLDAMLQGGEVAFDYPNRRIIAWSPITPLPGEGDAPTRAALVYSLRSGQWGMMQHQLATAINSYPEALAMTADHRLVDLATPDITSPTAGVMLATRPLNLAAPDLMKTLRTVALRGDIDRLAVGFALYGSRDLRHWVYIGSTRSIIKHKLAGSPYKWFRIVAVGQPRLDESLSGITVEWLPRMTAKLR